LDCIDLVSSAAQAHDDGIRGHGGAAVVQLNYGVKSLLSKGFPMKSSSEIPATLEDFI
jgi:hypothetical protein